MNIITEPKFGIGTEYLKNNKRKDKCTIIDILKTYNSTGEFVKLRYVSVHTFLGQSMVDSDVCETTVAIGVAMLKGEI